MMPAVWRDEDEALLARLTDESVLERVWRAQAGTAPLPSSRAAGLVAAVRRAPEGQKAFEEAAAGQLDALIQRIGPQQRAEDPPELLHHLALYHARLAEVGDGSSEAWTRSLVAWLALCREGKYLKDIGEAVTAGALPASDLARALDEAPFWPLEDLGRRAQQGARERTAAARVALLSLGRVAEACHRAGLSEALTKNLRRRAETLASAAVDDAMAPVLASVAEASAQGEVPAETAASLLARLVDVWEWSGRDESVEHCTIEQADPFLWAHYRKSRMDDVLRILSPIERLVDSLAQRIEGDPTRIAYAGPCAGVLFFRAEVTTDRNRRTEVLERCLRICPTHRNSRLVLANTLCDTATSRLAPRTRGLSRADYDEALALVDRAEKLFPASSRIEGARKQLDEAKAKLGIKS
jgi:hypothetical protein